MRRVVALGAESKTNFSTLTKDGLYLSPSVENLTNVNELQNFEDELRRHLKEKKLIADYVACDLHPDYCTSSLAEKFYAEGKSAKLIKVQHHFAHIACCMFDNGLDEEVIGVSFDGTGYGADGKSWGGEFLRCDRKSFKRLKHLEYVAAPGADIAAKEAWRMALSYLFLAYGDKLTQLDLDLLRRTPDKKIKIILQMIKQNVNSPLTSSAGRLFDAVSSLIGLCDVSSFEAEAAILLEKTVTPGVEEYYNYKITDAEIKLSGIICGIVDDLNSGASQGVISAKFHNTLGEIIFNTSCEIAKASGLNKVLISGGCFQNKYLTSYLKNKFANSKTKLFTHNQYSPTDLGISVGQAVVAQNQE